MKTVDFPTGHSMDTEWFAVDKNGNIAVFDSGQEGAIPLEFDRQMIWIELLEKYTIPISPVLKQLYLDEKMIEVLLQKCDVNTLQQIVENEFAVEGCIVLLNEGKKWEDLNLENALANEKEDFALCLSPKLPLYLLSDIYNVRIDFIAAVKNNVIAKACNLKVIWDEDEKGVGKRDLGLYLFDHDNNDWRTEPYYRIDTPEVPLNASQFVPNLINKIPHFKDIEFENQYCLQPMEFVSCETYLNKDEFENEYAKVKSSDNKEAYCLLPVSDQIHSLTKLGDCKKCYAPSISSYHLSCYYLRTYQDYPPIAIIKDAYIFNDSKWKQHEWLINLIYSDLNINKNDCLTTCCVKCYEFDKRENKQEFEFSRILEKFQNCYQHFNIEISVLQPLLLIAIEETVINLLKTKYEIANFSETPCLCHITINEKSYPLLVINNAKTDDEQAALSKFLSEKSDEIKTILSQPRNLPPPKPRVIQIEKND